MKRSELAVHMAVEIQHGRDYVRFDEAIVLAVEPWVDRSDGWSRFTRATRYGRAMDYDNRQGVAVAVERHGSWSPAVVQLRSIVPVGTKAEHEERKRRERERTQRAQDDIDTRRRHLSERFGATVRFASGYPRSEPDDTEVVVATEALEALLDEVERCREKENEG